jgi:hypothetical protein
MVNNLQKILEQPCIFFYNKSLINRKKLEPELELQFVILAPALGFGSSAPAPQHVSAVTCRENGADLSQQGLSMVIILHIRLNYCLFS